MTKKLTLFWAILAMAIATQASAQCCVPEPCEPACCEAGCVDPCCQTQVCDQLANLFSGCKPCATLSCDVAPVKKNIYKSDCEPISFPKLKLAGPCNPCAPVACEPASCEPNCCDPCCKPAKPLFAITCGKTYYHKPLYRKTIECGTKPVYKCEPLPCGATCGTGCGCDAGATEPVQMQKQEPQVAPAEKAALIPAPTPEQGAFLVAPLPIR